MLCIRTPEVTQLIREFTTKGSEIGILQKYLPFCMFIIELFTIAKIWKQLFFKIETALIYSFSKKKFKLVFVGE